LKDQTEPKSDPGDRRKTLTALLFVGGLSRRMGTDKAELRLAGEPLWARQLNLLRELKPDFLWISARARPAWCPPEIEVVIDEPPSRGPLSGLTAALRKLKTSHLLALAVDLPRMSAEPLDKLWRLSEAGCGIIPAHDNVLEPLCAIYPAEAALTAAAALRVGGDVSLRSFVEALRGENRMRIYPLNEPELRCFYNMNTPDDLAACPR
jgi:molybdopterin-guanine dinucleotide biosynthesis protein A